MSIFCGALRGSRLFPRTSAQCKRFSGPLGPNHDAAAQAGLDEVFQPSQ